MSRVGYVLVLWVLLPVLSKHDLTTFSCLECLGTAGRDGHQPATSSHPTTSSLPPPSHNTHAQIAAMAQTSSVAARTRA